MTDAPRPSGPARASRAPRPALPVALPLAATLLFFAANSVLGRAALGELPAGQPPDPAAYTALRLVSGAAMLALIVAAREGAGGARAALSRARAVPALSLLGYAAFFSVAYAGIAAGLGALVLFGAVQVTMFAGALAMGERPPPMRWLGAGAGLAGLAWLAAPGAEAPPLVPALLMAASGASWGVFSLVGRGSARPVADMAGAFALASVAGTALWAMAAAAGFAPGMGAREAGLAVASGAVTSALGYAMWYAVLPRIDATLASVAQLAVPLIALAGGARWLGEVPSSRFWIAAALILGGVGAATLASRRR
ncbi:MAG: DMT family transporter [Pseudomonadota bacterium]|nr:DMT family transporter [Pseudomonadota bacterium]MEE3099215.1 DMT family transporter [Pseudomonadota bacterium]